jgi:hypothetical protein
MKYENQPQDNYLRHLYTEAVVNFDKDPLEKLTDEENIVLCQPEKIFGTARTLFEQYAIKDPDFQNEFFRTPELPVKYTDQRLPGYVKTGLFISHQKDTFDTYTVTKKVAKGVDFVDLPIYQIVSDKKDALVLGPDFNPIEAPEELAKTRIILKEMKKHFSKEAHDQANSVDYRPYLENEPGDFIVPDYMLFYFRHKSSGNRTFQYPTGFNALGKAFEDAVYQFYEDLEDEPKPGYPVEFKLMGASFVHRDEQIKITTENLLQLWGLYRELTTFDSDKFTIEQMRQQFVNRQISN